MNKINIRWVLLLSVIVLSIPKKANADFFGGDIPLLSKIVATTAEQLVQLRQILGTGKDTLGLLREINQGVRQAMSLARTMNDTIHSGVFSEFKNLNDVQRAIEALYGLVPDTGSAMVEKSQDNAISEAIDIHNQAFLYAEKVDLEAERIKEYAKNVSPAGAGKLTAQSLGVLIHVSDQILRTNSAILKMLGQSAAVENRHQKMESKAFKYGYDGMATGLKNLTSMNESLNLKNQ